jgi:predicted permease
MLLGDGFEALGRNLRYGVRQLYASPGFTAIAVASLALGIGANTAVFELIDAVRLRTLPLRAPEELVSVELAKNSMRSGWSSTRSARLTYGLWEQIRSRQQVFSGVAAWSATRFNLARGGEARYTEGLYVSGDFFETLGVAAMVGRAITATDDRPACAAPGAVISYSFWQREFAGDPNVLTRRISLDGRPFPIIGVTPAAFFGVEVGRQYEAAVPLCADALLAAPGFERIPNRRAWWLSMMGRLKPGYTERQVQANLQALAPAIMQATLPPTYRPDSAKRYLANQFSVTAGATGVSQLRQQYETPLWLLFATTGFVLLIACANLANLLLARASLREREIAIRQAIGASRRKLITQLLVESLLLAGLGAALGIAVEQILSRSLVAFLSTPNNPLFVGLSLDRRLLAFTIGMTGATALLFGLLPALRATRLAPVAAMRAGGRSVTAGRERFSLRRALVATQVALSMVLLMGALLFVRSLENLFSVDPGFRPEGIVAVELDFRRQNYDKERFPVVYQDLFDRIRRRPGVVSLAKVNIYPVSGSSWDSMVYPDGKPELRKNVNFSAVGPGYFHTIGTPILAGRDMNGTDGPASPKVALVNQTFARNMFGAADPIGRVIRVEGEAGKPDVAYQILGLVGNTKYLEIREDFRPIIYLALAQDESPNHSGAEFILRATGSHRDLVANILAAVAEVNPEIGIQFRVLTQRIKDTLLRDRLMATLSGAFGLLAGLLATLGLYGVISYMVAQRRNEIGVRMALGADRGRVIGLVMREAGVLLMIGLTAGTALAVWTARAGSTLLISASNRTIPRRS